MLAAWAWIDAPLRLWRLAPVQRCCVRPRPSLSTASPMLAASANFAGCLGRYVEAGAGFEPATTDL